MSLHRCTDAECAYFGQATTKGCLCHQTDEQVLTEQRDCLLAALKGALGALEQDVDASADYNDADWSGIANERLAAARAAIAKAGGAS